MRLRRQSCRPDRLALLALAASALLAGGCGESAETASGPGGATASKTVRVANASQASLGVTAGRIGDATTASDRSGERALSEGRRLRPRDAEPTVRQRAGVGAGAQCGGIL